MAGKPEQLVTESSWHDYQLLPCMSTCSLGEDTFCLSVPSNKKFYIEGETQMPMDSLEEFTENRAAGDLSHVYVLKEGMVNRWSENGQGEGGEVM